MGVDPAGLAKVMARGVGVPLIEGQIIRTLDKPEILFPCCDHNGAFAPADGTVAAPVFLDPAIHLELYRTAMA